MATKLKSLFEAVSAASNSFNKEIKLIDMQDRLISGSEKPEDQIDRAIRPASLDDYIGQPVVREQMEIFIGAARGRAGRGFCAGRRRLHQRSPRRHAAPAPQRAGDSRGRRQAGHGVQPRGAAGCAGLADRRHRPDPDHARQPRFWRSVLNR